MAWSERSFLHTPQRELRGWQAVHCWVLHRLTVGSWVSLHLSFLKSQKTLWPRRILKTSRGARMPQEGEAGPARRKCPEKRRHLWQPLAEPARKPETLSPPTGSRSRSPHRSTSPASAGSRYLADPSNSPRSRSRRAAGRSAWAGAGSGPHPAGTVRALGPAVRSA